MSTVCENCGSTRLMIQDIEEQKIKHVVCYDCGLEWVE